MVDYVGHGTQNPAEIPCPPVASCFQSEVLESGGRQGQQNGPCSLQFNADEYVMQKVKANTSGETRRCPGAESVGRLKIAAHSLGSQISFNRCGAIWLLYGRQALQGVAVFLAACFIVSLDLDCARAVDRTTLFLPLAPDAVTSRAARSEAGDVLYADVAFGEGASQGWKAYRRLWQAHHADPSNSVIRRFLGLPLEGNFESTAKRGRSAPSWLGWKPGSYAQVDTAHFTLHSKADRESSMRVAEDLERCYWIWTQMFFPLWESNAQVSLALKEMGDDEPVVSFLERSPQRITTRRKLRVVLCSNADEYRKVLGATPGVELSTGFYSDKHKTVLLFASQQDDPATRRHELVHQLFREATRSGLGRNMPANDEGFWLIEGIAGYFESLHLGTDMATVGGWDSSRLQFARYRLLVGGDSMPMEELQQDGRESAQARSDIARWYAHAILRTHQLLDGGNEPDRRWVYGRLAAHYRIKSEVAVDTQRLEWDALDRSVRSFLAIDDMHLMENRISYPMKQLCLAGCEVTEAGLQTIPASPSLKWLDLARLPIGNAAVQRLAPDPEKLQQLNLEATRIDRGLGEWLQRAKNLNEVDLSWTTVGDAAIESLRDAAEITTLWMTGTQISDQSVNPILEMPVLKSVDVQRTNVSAAGVQRLQTVGSRLDVNPLQLRTE